MDKIRILIADDHPMFRQGLKQILELEKDMEVIAQASSGNEVVQLARECKPDIVLMDINMPEGNGIWAIEELKRGENPPKIVVLTIHEDREYLFRTIQLGVEGYILKDAEPSVLISAIRSVHQGQTYIQANMTKELVREFNRITLHERTRGELNNLTQRELEVLGLIAEGMINKEIAKKLYISEKTVKNHVSNIFKKLKVSDRTQAAIYAFKNNIKSWG